MPTAVAVFFLLSPTYLDYRAVFASDDLDRFSFICQNNAIARVYGREEIT